VKRAAWIIGASLVITVIGFWPSFFAVLPQTSASNLVHGSAATIWMILGISQALLAVTGRRRIHRTAGYASLALAVVVVLSGLHVVQNMVLGNQEPFSITAIKFVLLDFGFLTVFSVFLLLGVRAARRHDYASHTRYMVGTALVVLSPPLERLSMTWLPSLVPTFDRALYASLIGIEVIIGFLLFLDRRNALRHPQLLILAVFYAAMAVLATPVAEAPAFQSFALWFAHLGR
jgi:hypothetical protein